MIAITPELSWPTPCEAVGLECNQIHVWCAALSEFASELGPLNALLSSRERERAERFRFAKDRNHFVARRGILRGILSRYLEQPPPEIDLRHGRFGKPEVNGDFVRGNLQFSVSHSADLALYAVTRACPIGVDVEHVRPFPQFEKIASRFFSPHEREMLMALRPEQQSEGFFACWTRKEAFLKATGEGLGRDLAEVEVTLAPWDEPEFLSIKCEPPLRAEWQLRSFSPAPGYLAALAFAHHDLVLSRGRVCLPLC
jgi:4'-phosphopantetheinyl transferase